jgi:hypothetical protein
LQRVENMLAAGWGATGSVMQMDRAGGSLDRMSGLMPMVSAAAPLKKRRQSAIDMPDMMREAMSPESTRGAPMGMAIPANHPRATGAGLHKPGGTVMAGAPASVALPSLKSQDYQRLYGVAPFNDLADLILDHLRAGGQLGSLDEHAKALPFHRELRSALDAVIGLGIGSSLGWTLIALWLDTRSDRAVSAALSEGAKLRASRLDPELVAKAYHLFDRLRDRVAPSTTAA